MLAGAFGGAKPIHVGRWLLASPTDPTVSLSFEPAKVPAPVAAVMRRTTVDALGGGYACAYALGFAGNGTPSTLAASNDGGLTWAAARATRLSDGAEADWAGADQQHAVDRGRHGRRHDPPGHRLGRRARPGRLRNIHGYFSRNRGDDFEPIGGWPELGGIEPQLHDDVHVVAFDPGDPIGRRVVLASDGGLL